MRPSSQGKSLHPKALPLMNTYASIHNIVNTSEAHHSARIHRGLRAEHAVVHLLRSAGRACTKQVHQCPFDILADGWRIDVKTAIPREASGQQRFHGDRWLFNLHHSGRPITGCDFFVLRMENVPAPEPPVLHLLLRAPYHAISFAVHSFTFNKTLPLITEFNRFLRGEYGTKHACTAEGQYLLPEVCHA